MDIQKFNKLTEEQKTYIEQCQIYFMQCSLEEKQKAFDILSSKNAHENYELILLDVYKTILTDAKIKSLEEKDTTKKFKNYNKIFAYFLLIGFTISGCSLAQEGYYGFDFFSFFSIFIFGFTLFLLFNTLGQIRKELHEIKNNLNK